MSIKKLLASITFSGMTLFGGMNVARAEKNNDFLKDLDQVIMCLEKGRFDKNDDLKLRAKGVLFFKRDLEKILAQIESQNHLDLSKYKKMRIKEIGGCRKNYLVLFDNEDHYVFVDYDGFIDPKKAKSTTELSPDILFEKTDGTTTKIDLKKGTFIIEWHQGGKKMSGPVLSYFSHKKNVSSSILPKNMDERTHN